jgi:hypothetical protein
MWGAAIGRDAELDCVQTFRDDVRAGPAGLSELPLLLTEPGDGPPDPLAIGLAVHDVLRPVHHR